MYIYIYIYVHICICVITITKKTSNIFKTEEACYNIRNSQIYPKRYLPEPELSAY